MSFIFDFDETITKSETTSLLQQLSTREYPTKKELWNIRVDQYYKGYNQVYNQVLHSTIDKIGTQSFLMIWFSDKFQEIESNTNTLRDYELRSIQETEACSLLEGLSQPAIRTDTESVQLRDGAAYVLNKGIPYISFNLTTSVLKEGKHCSIISVSWSRDLITSTLERFINKEYYNNIKIYCNDLEFNSEQVTTGKILGILNALWYAYF